MKWGNFQKRQPTAYSNFHSYSNLNWSWFTCTNRHCLPDLEHFSRAFLGARSPFYCYFSEPEFKIQSATAWTLSFASKCKSNWFLGLKLKDKKLLKRWREIQALSLFLNQTNAPYLLGGRVSKNEDARAGRSTLHYSQLTMLGSFPGLPRDTPAPSPRSWRVRKVDARKTGR